MFFFFIIIDFFFFVSWIFYGNILAEFDKFLAPEFAKKKLSFKKVNRILAPKMVQALLTLLDFIS